MVIVSYFKRYFLLLFGISLFFLNCKSEKKQIPKNKRQIEIVSPVNQSYTSQKQIRDTLRSPLIGKTLEYVKSIKPFNSLDYSSTGIHIEPDSNVNFSLGYFNSNSQTVDFLVFLKKHNNDKVVIDVLKLQDEMLLSNKNNRLSTFFCYKDGMQDEEIIAIAKYEEEEFLTKILKAWRADRKTEKIIEIPVEGIKVENMGYGI
ncbi:hypothetical protein [Tenacibaculum geojense]|uniref:Lipoprotein n=1 Tax=Tenacibaculum geojense TaxID=915352 RepID=A0ABW3JS89_9FLAO